MRWRRCFGLPKTIVWRKVDFLLHLKFQNLLKYVQNQRAKTIFVFSTKIYLLKHGIFLQLFVEERMGRSLEETQEEEEKKQLSSKEKKAKSAWDPLKW